jgi:G3E family GTPase
MTIPGIEVPMDKKTIIPDPETHVSFSTKLMVLAIELYMRDAPRDFCHDTSFAHKKLLQFVESRKEMTAESYRFFAEHAYNQFFQHEAFHQSARARTKAKDLSAGEFHTSTRLDGYVWIAARDKMVHIPKDQAEDVEMQKDDDEEEVEHWKSVSELRFQRKRRKKMYALRRERKHPTIQDTLKRQRPLRWN